MLPLRSATAGTSAASPPVDTDGATVFVYDAYGVAGAELGWEAGTEHLAATLEAIDSCECTDGCPSRAIPEMWQRQRSARQSERDHTAGADSGTRFPSGCRDLNRQTLPASTLPEQGLDGDVRESGTAFYDANVTEAAFFDLDKTVIASSVLAFGPACTRRGCSTVGWSFGRCGARSCSATSVPTRAAW